MKQIFENSIIHKASLGSREVPQKIWARLVQSFWRLLDTNRQAKYIYTYIYLYICLGIRLVTEREEEAKKSKRISTHFQTKGIKNIYTTILQYLEIYRKTARLILPLGVSRGNNIENINLDFDQVFWCNYTMFRFTLRI